jgi:hypothetical protein
MISYTVHRYSVIKRHKQGYMVMMNDSSDNFPQQSIKPNSRYELRINGRLAQETATWFEDVTLIVDETTTPPQTILQGIIRDQSALYGLISRIRDLGLLLVSVNLIEQKRRRPGKQE